MRFFSLGGMTLTICQELPQLCPRAPGARRGLFPQAPHPSKGSGGNWGKKCRPGKESWSLGPSRASGTTWASGAREASGTSGASGASGVSGAGGASGQMVLAAAGPARTIGREVVFGLSSDLFGPCGMSGDGPRQVLEDPHKTGCSCQADGLIHLPIQVLDRANTSMYNIYIYIYVYVYIYTYTYIYIYCVYIYIYTHVNNDVRTCIHTFLTNDMSSFLTNAYYCFSTCQNTS